jgi:hypothetical protein
MNNNQKNLTLSLHRGAKEVERATVNRCKTPEGTDTWHPIGHRLLLDTIEQQLKGNDFQVTDQVHGLGHGGNRYFGLLRIESKIHPANPEYSWVLGLRNSHDKAFPAAVAAGSHVFCCDNLAFHSEIRLDRRHTKHIERDLPNVVSRAVGRLSERWTDLDKRIAAYKDRPLTDVEAHDLMIRCMDAGAVGIQAVPLVLKEWRTPKHEEFAPRNVWSLFNDFTEVLKKSNIFKLAPRSEALHGVMDAACGLLIKENNN